MPGRNIPPRAAAPPPTLPPGEAAIAGAEAIRAAKAEATINFLMLSPLSCCFDGKHALGLAVPGLCLSVTLELAQLSRINRGFVDPHQSARDGSGGAAVRPRPILRKDAIARYVLQSPLTLRRSETI